MTSTGTTTVHYHAKKKMRLGAYYDSAVGLGAVTLDGDINSTTYLNLVELERLHSRLGYVLEQMVDAKAIGFDAYSKNLEREIDKLEREIQPKPEPKRSRRKTLPPCDLTPAQLRAAATAEIEKIKAARARGEYR